MKELPVFVTGNKNKAAYLQKWLGVPLPHESIDLHEVQSLDFAIVAREKARRAYELLKRPVLVDDTGFCLEYLGGKLPGPLSKWFEIQLSLEEICNLVPDGASRGASVHVAFCLYDGKAFVDFIGKVDGQLAIAPRGNKGFGYDPIIIPNGHTKTYAEMDDDELKVCGLRITTVYPQIKRYLVGS